MDITSAYCKNKGDVYFSLLNLAKPSCDEYFSQIEKKEAIKALNKLKEYLDVHKRIIPLLNAKSRKLYIFDKLDLDIQQLLNNETKKGIVTELAKKMQLNEIVNALNKHNIPIILLKGVAFNDVLYTRETPRVSNDIDILVKCKDWDLTIDILSKIMIYKDNDGGVLDELTEISFIPKGNCGAALDLHKAITYPFLFNIDEEFLWSSSIPQHGQNNPQVRALSPEVAIVHQAIHAFVDMDFGKYNLLDCHELITKTKPDFDLITHISHKWGVSTAVYILLDNSSKVMGTSIKEEVLKGLKPKRFKYFMAYRIIKNLFYRQKVNLDKKSIMYRWCQLLSQFLFTDSVFKPVKFQLLYIYLSIKKLSYFLYSKYCS